MALVKTNRIVTLYASGGPVHPIDTADQYPSVRAGTLRTDPQLSIDRIGSALDAILHDVRLLNYALTEQELETFYKDVSW